MSAVYRRQASPRRAVTLALLAGTALATVLGGCNQTGPFSRNSSDLGLDETKVTDSGQAANVTAQWAAAYAKKPYDPRMALGYGRSLRAIGAKAQAFQVLKTAYQANPRSGELAAELGRLALDTGQLDVAKHTLKVAEAQNVNDWKTLSAQGALRAQQGEHAQAQQYFLAALKKQPDAVPVINNLALSYALDGKPDKAETLLRDAMHTGGADNKRVRQNLALVLGLQGKFGEAKQVASADMSDDDNKANVAYMRNMLNKPTRYASAGDDQAGTPPSGGDWQPFGANEANKAPAPKRTAMVEQPLPQPKPPTQKAAPVPVAAAKPAPAKPAPVKSATANPAAETGKLTVAAAQPTSILPSKQTTTVAKTAAPAANTGNPLRPDID